MSQYRSTLTIGACALGVAALIGLLIWARQGSPEFFMPHGHCYFWDPGLVSLHVISDLLIALSYVSISTTLGYMVFILRNELPFHWLFLAFGIFIIACGGTHFVEAWTVWHPSYWFAGDLKAVTAVASLTTALVLPSRVPKVKELLLAMKQVRRQKAALEAEVERRCQIEEELTEANARLKAANLQLESFSYSVSHDLRAPLRHMKGFAELLNKRSAASLDEKGRQQLDIVLQSADRMGLLMDQLLDFSRLGRAALDRRKVDLGAVAERAKAELAGEQESRTVSWDIGKLPFVEADAGLLHLVFLNLFSNALKFTRGKSEACIEVKTESSEPMAVISVRDNGVGFEPAYSGKLFGVFQRLHKVDDFEGTGIGLANVRRIVTLHGGETWAEGIVGKGATFFFSLPKSSSNSPTRP